MPVNGSGPLRRQQRYVLAQAAGNAAALVINKATLTTALTGTVSKTYNGTTVAPLSSANFAPLSGIIGQDNVTLVFPSTGTYDTANVGTGKTVTASGLSLGGAKANDYTINGSASGRIGEITGVQAPEAPVLTSVTAAVQAAASTLSTPQTTFTQTTLVTAAITVQPPITPPPTIVTAIVPAAAIVAPPRPNPLESLTLSSSVAGGAVLRRTTHLFRHGDERCGRQHGRRLCSRRRRIQRQRDPHSRHAAGCPRQDPVQCQQRRRPVRLGQSGDLVAMTARSGGDILPAAAAPIMC